MELFDMVRMADKIKDCQRSAKFLFKDDYPKHAEEYRKVIKAVMESEGKGNPFAAVTHICVKNELSGVTEMLLISVAADMVEKEKGGGNG